MMGMEEDDVDNSPNSLYSPSQYSEPETSSTNTQQQEGPVHIDFEGAKRGESARFLVRWQMEKRLFLVVFLLLGAAFVGVGTYICKYESSPTFVSD